MSVRFGNRIPVTVGKIVFSYSKNFMSSYAVNGLIETAVLPVMNAVLDMQLPKNTMPLPA